MQFVSVESVCSFSCPLNCGVPRGSFFSPILYLLYVDPLGDIMRHHNVSFHFYGDDSQLYVSFKSSIAIDFVRARSKLEFCARNIDKRMLCNNLKLIDDKTEMLVFFFMLNTVPPPLYKIQVATASVISSDSAKNIGAVLDSTLSFDNHVMQICKSSFYAIRNISCIRKFLSTPTALILVHAFITSKLDSCNSLLYGLPKNLLQRLQYVLNSAAMSRIQIMLHHY